MAIKRKRAESIYVVLPAPLIDDSGVMLQLVASFTIVVYECLIFIEQATDSLLVIVVRLKPILTILDAQTTKSGATAFSIMTLSIMALSIMTFSITIRKTQHSALRHSS